MLPEAPRRPTSHDVAHRAGVSRTTVSLVLNGKRLERIAPATRQRVLDAAAALGYVPHAAGRSLVSGRTGTLGLVVGHARHLAVDGFLPQVLTALGEEAHAAGVRVLVDAVDDPARPDAYAQRVRAGQIDGLVVVNPRAPDPALQELAASGYPLAVIGRLPGHPELCTADHDDAAGRLIGRHLLRHGRRRVAYLGFAPAARATTVAPACWRRCGRAATTCPNAPSATPPSRPRAATAPSPPGWRTASRTTRWRAATTPSPSAPWPRCATTVGACRTTSPSSASTTCRSRASPCPA